MSTAVDFSNAAIDCQRTLTSYGGCTVIPGITDVLIVGAGPAGLSLAATLAAGNVDFVLIDRLAEGQNTSRAAAVHARTLEVLEGIGVSDRLVAAGLRLP